MATWKILSQTVTSKGHPRTFAIRDPFGMEEKMVVHVVAAERTSGGNDDTMPRRAMGMGADRASARRSLEHVISAWDSAYHVLDAR